MSDLNREEIIQLIADGWKCDNFPGLCSLDSHNNKVHRLLEDDSTQFNPENSVNQGNSIILHIGKVNARVRSECNTDDYLIIPPGYFAFFMTREILNMPLDCDGTLFMNPRVANRGLLFFTLGHVDPGFRGRLTGTLLNTTSREIKIDKKTDEILYLVVSRLEKPSKPHRTHERPQLKEDEALRDLTFSMNPGFALTTEDFATKKDLENTRNLLIAFVSLIVATVSVVAAVLKLLQ